MLGSEEAGDGEREDWSETRGFAGADFRRVGGAVVRLSFLCEVVDDVVVVGRGGLKAGVLRLGAGGMRSGGMLRRPCGESFDGVAVSSVNIDVHARRFSRPLPGPPRPACGSFTSCSTTSRRTKNPPVRFT